jgi:serine protease
VLDTGVAFEDYTDPRTGQVFRKAPDWGETRFVQGYDFFNDDAHANDDRNHGTHVASTIAEGTNNGMGVAGLAFGCAIMPVKVLGASGVGTFFALADGIDYAINYTENGMRPVKVINLSLSSSSFNQTVKSALDRAAAAGVLVVASSGNNGASSVNFPADQENVVGVGALNAAKQKAWYSNTGPELDLVAPGGDCDRDDDGNGVPDCVFQQTMRAPAAAGGRYDDFAYFGFQGTSMAAPHVSAAAALLFSQGFTDAGAVRKALEQTAERLGGAPPGGRNDAYGNGLVLPAAALPGYGLNVGTKK